MTSNAIRSNVKQRQEFNYKRHCDFDMYYQSKTSYFLLNCIERTLSSLYQKGKKDSPIKEKNKKNRQNQNHFLPVLMILDKLYYKLEEHSANFYNKIWIQCGNGEFEKFFPNINNLFYERYILGKTIPGLEEGELDENPGISVEEVCLHDFAQRLSKLGLGHFDKSKSLHYRYQAYLFDKFGHYDLFGSPGYYPYDETDDEEDFYGDWYNDDEIYL